MDINLFSDIKPTSDILAFDEGIEEIPCISKGNRKLNPLDENVVIGFKFDNPREYVYYLPKTGEARISDVMLHDNEDFKRLFGVQIADVFYIRDRHHGYIRNFLFGTVLGGYLVYRRFEISVSCRKNGNGYKCEVSKPGESCRYVFGDHGVFIENRDHSKTITTADKIAEDEAYDTLRDADGSMGLALYQSFIREVDISHKEDIIRALNHVKKGHTKFEFKVFAEIFSKAVNNKGIAEDTPRRISRELYTRKHPADTAVKITKDLVVVTGGKECEYLDCREETRAYFDKHNAYFFRKNAVTGKWQTDESFWQISKNRYIEGRLVDGEIFENTCMERYIEYSVDSEFRRGIKINLGVMLAQVGFLSAEQAAKIQSPVFDVIIRNIFAGKISDGNKSLPELLGITGAQLKFLKDIHMPNDLEHFSEYMEAEDFRSYFPDVKKRIFAVAFYLNSCTGWDTAWDLTKEEVFEAAQTLNSIERTEGEKREHILLEYGDYLRMRRPYYTYVQRMREDDPLRQEILAYGDMPVNIKPSRISDCHNKIGRIVDLIRCSDKITKFTAAIEERYEKESDKREYSNGEYSMLMPQNAEDIIREGRELQHCVGRAGYIEAMAANRCTILFLRSNKKLNKPLITIEERDGEIRQCYGIRDSLNNSIEVRDFIKEYAALNNLRIDAVIYSEHMERGRYV